MSAEQRGSEPTVELPIRGCVVHEIWFWGIVRLKLVRDAFEASIDFASGTFAGSRSAEPRPFDTEGSVEAVHWFVDLWHQHLRQATVSEDGTLRIEFENGATLTLPSMDGVEAWNYCDSEDHHVIAMPSGGIVWWGSPVAGIERLDGPARSDGAG